MPRIRKQHNNEELAELVRTISLKLKQFRAKEGLSQNELARQAGISKSTVNELENLVATDLQLSTLCQLGKVLRKRVVDFLVPTDLNLADPDRRELLKAAEDLERVSRVMDRLKLRVRATGSSDGSK